MRYYTPEEEVIYERLRNDKNLTEEERKKLIDKLNEIEMEVTNGYPWLT